MQIVSLVTFLVVMLCDSSVVAQELNAANLQNKIVELQHTLDQHNQMLAKNVQSINHVWEIIAAALVLFMQFGFLLIESGMVRSKNTINVAQKNLSDFFVSISFFYIVGFGIMFGHSASDIGFIGTDDFLWNETADWHYTFFIFQAVFVGTATTIVSGAVAERMKYSAYIFIAILISTTIYPIYGHLAWGNLYLTDNPAYLADKGFIDFAGSTVVHSIGGWVALAAIIILGPRMGKFNDDGTVNVIHGHSYVLASAGAIILWIGWIGFNGGSTYAGTPELAHIISNTILAAAFGGFASVIVGYLKDKSHIPYRSINGSIAGLVGVTAGCNIYDTYGAITIGAICGVLVVFAQDFIERNLKLDDVVGAVSTHGIAGLIGTVLVAYIAPEERLNHSRIDQLLVQIEGVSIAFLWTFFMAYTLLKLFDKIVGIRISHEQETIGLNFTEHQSSIGTYKLKQDIENMLTDDGKFDLTIRLDESTGDDSSDIARQINPFLDEIQNVVMSISQQSTMLKLASDNLIDISQNFVNNSVDLSDNTENSLASTQEVSGKIKENTDISNEMARNTSSITSAATDMSHSVNHLSDAIEQIVASINEIVTSANETKEITQKTESMFTQANETISTLSETSKEIDTVVALISSISKQTNMLALNATVEAERAGEAGAGFAVVANEVKDLARQTSQAAEIITKHIEDIQQGSSNAHDMITKLSSFMQTINESITKVNHSVADQKTNISEIFEDISSTKENVNKVSQNMNDIDSQAKKLAGNSENINTLAENISDSSSLVNQRAKVNVEKSKDIIDSATNLSGVANMLNSASDKFIISNKNSDTSEDDNDDDILF